jgi:hypothetical protein
LELPCDGDPIQLRLVSNQLLSAYTPVRLFFTPTAKGKVAKLIDSLVSKFSGGSIVHFSQRFGAFTFEAFPNSPLFALLNDKVSQWLASQQAKGLIAFFQRDREVTLFDTQANVSSWGACIALLWRCLLHSFAR